MKTIAWHKSAETQEALVYLLRTAGIDMSGKTPDFFDDRSIIWNDERIAIKWMDGWIVYVSDAEYTQTLVLRTDSIEVHAYRPGLWERYVVEVHREIAHEEALLENERMDEIAKLRLEAFQPIDDAEIFPELAVKKGA